MQKLPLNQQTIRKVAGPFRISTNSDGSLRGFRLPASGGGSQVKVILYMIKVYQESGNAKVGLNLDHGPDGEIYVSFGTIITTTAFTSTPDLLTGATGTPDTDASDILGEWLVPILTIEEDSAVGTGEWAVVELYEIRKYH